MANAHVGIRSGQNARLGDAGGQIRIAFRASAAVPTVRHGGQRDRHGQRDERALAVLAVAAVIALVLFSFAVQASMQRGEDLRAAVRTADAELADVRDAAYRERQTRRLPTR